MQPMKMFGTPSLELPSAEEERKRGAQEHYTKYEEFINERIQELSDILNEAKEHNIDLDNDYDERMHDPAYREMRDQLLAKRTKALMLLEKAEMKRDKLEREHGVTRHIDA